jgi:hypothetical protein
MIRPAATAVRPHPNVAKAELRALLATDRVVTTAQLGRWGLRSAAEWLGLPQLTRTCRTRVTQSESTVDLTFVAFTEALLDQAPRDLMHLCGLAEIRRARALVPGEQWRHVTLGNRRRGHLPDAEIIQMLDPTRRSDTAVEFDAGYSTTRCKQKLMAAAASGYSRILWATSVHARTRTVGRIAHQLQRSGHLPEVSEVQVRFVDFWSIHNPYVNRPRCHKLMELTQAYTTGAPESHR